MAGEGTGVRAAAAPSSMCVISSGNGIRATARAMEMMRQGADPIDAVISGVNIVELDASVMHGPAHSAGAVASIRNIKTPSRVARLVMERTDHALLVGEGAL